MKNINNDLFNQYIILKKYLNEEEKIEIEKLEDICKKYDEVILKLELDYKNKLEKDYKNNINEINEFLYYSNKELIGYASISCFNGNVAEINGMVHPEFRRNGIFTKVIDLVLNECKKRSFSEILLLCDDKSDSGRYFIEYFNGKYSFSECRMNCKELNFNSVDERIKFKKANNKDINKINELNRLFFGEGCNEKILPEDEERNGAITYLICLSDEVIGKIKVTKEFNGAYISGFGILPKYRGMGYGKRSIIKVLKKLNEEKITNITLDVEIKNKNALNLYKSCGFKEESIINYYRIYI